MGESLSIGSNVPKRVPWFKGVDYVNAPPPMGSNFAHGPEFDRGETEHKMVIRPYAIVRPIYSTSTAIPRW